MPWIYNEDGALKTKLQGLTVDGGTPVAVRFRLPETEVANVTYPMLVIDHVGFSPAHEREHRGFVKLTYAPEGQTPWWGDSDTSITLADSPFYSNYPIPMNLDYQVTLYARKAMHGVTLVPTLATQPYLPPRFGYVIIPQDNTVRSLDLIGGPEPSTVQDQDGKRLFTWTYMVRIFSEILLSQVETFNKVANVSINLTPYLDTYDAVLTH